MDSMIGIFIFSFIALGLILVKIVNKTINSSDHTSSKYDQKEVFPPIKPLVLSGESVETHQNRHKKNFPDNSIQKEGKKQTKIPESLVSEERASSSSGRLHLHSYNEARKAFIYSEIFNRKYE